MNKDGTTLFVSAAVRARLDKVRHVGEAVATVIAETVAAAKDGAEHVEAPTRSCTR